MKPKRLKLIVRVDLNPMPGEFYTINQARDRVAGILSERIPQHNPVVTVKPEKRKRNGKKRRYEAKDFWLDFVMVCLTGGLWFIWIYIRETRDR